jgi:uncharacterized alpha-E superfamily protein
MLARLADNLYWFGRYVQRAENTARLLNVNTILSLDLPRRVQLGWEPLVDLVGARELFQELCEAADEENVVRFLTVEERNGGSILGSLHRAREALRTTRDYMPGDVWERVNDLFFLVQDKGDRSLGRARRHAFLNDVMDGTLAIHGFLAFNMSHDVGFHFFGLGANLEQADMTTRILDARSTRTIQPRADGDGAGTFEAVEWMSVLRSLAAQQTYRRQTRSRVAGVPVARFLLQNCEFPRSVSCCLLGIRATLPHLPSHPEVEQQVERTLTLVRQADVETLIDTGMKQLMDDIQKGLDGLHGAVSAAFFRS